MRKTLTKKQVRKALAEASADILKKHFGVTDLGAEKTFERLLSETGLLAALFDEFHQRMKCEMEEKGGITNEELQKGIAEMGSRLAARTPLIRKGMKDMLKNIPRHGGPGRKGALDKADKLEAIESISAAVKHGKEKKLAAIFASVAKSFDAKGKKVSARTIKRVWEQRANLQAHPDELAQSISQGKLLSTRIE